MSIAALVAADDDDRPAPRPVTRPRVALRVRHRPVLGERAGGRVHARHERRHRRPQPRGRSTPISRPPTWRAATAPTLDLSSASNPVRTRCAAPSPATRDAGMEATLTVTEGGATAAPPTEGEHPDEHSTMDYEADDRGHARHHGAVPGRDRGVGNPLLEPTEVKADGTKVFDLTMELADWERAPGNVVQAWTFNGMVPAPSIGAGGRRQGRVAAARTNCPSPPTSTSTASTSTTQFDGVAPITQDLIEPGDTFTYEYTADEVRWRCTTRTSTGQIGCPTACSGRSSSARCADPAGADRRRRGSPGRPQDQPGDPDGAQRLRRDRLQPERQELPGHRARSRRSRATGCCSTTSTRAPRSIRCTCTSSTRSCWPRTAIPSTHPYVADVVNVAPGERYSVLVQLDKPGAWVWHCHILPHVEDENGMFGMVTAVIVE